MTSHSHRQMALAAAAGALLAASSSLALVTYYQFGWRQQSKLAQDRRTKNVGERQNAQVQVKRFLAALKLDCQARPGPLPPLSTATLEPG